MGVDMTATCVLWVRASLNCEPLFSFLDGLRPDSENRYWIDRKVIEKNISDIQVDSGQISKGVEILLKMSHKAPVKRRGAYTMIDKRLRNEIVQRILIISAVSTLHFDKFNHRNIKLGNKCSLGCLRGNL
jgi:hypothetical protein